MQCRNPYCRRRTVDRVDHEHGSCDENCSTCNDNFPIDTNDDLEDREDY